MEARWPRLDRGGRWRRERGRGAAAADAGGRSRRRRPRAASPPSWRPRPRPSATATGAGCARPRPRPRRRWRLRWTPAAPMPTPRARPPTCAASRGAAAPGRRAGRAAGGTGARRRRGRRGAAGRPPRRGRPSSPSRWPQAALAAAGRRRGGRGGAAERARGGAGVREAAAAPSDGRGAARSRARACWRWRRPSSAARGCRRPRGRSRTAGRGWWSRGSRRSRGTSGRWPPRWAGGPARWWPSGWRMPRAARTRATGELVVLGGPAPAAGAMPAGGPAAGRGRARSPTARWAPCSRASGWSTIWRRVTSGVAVTAEGAVSTPTAARLWRTADAAEAAWLRPRGERDRLRDRAGRRSSSRRRRRRGRGRRRAAAAAEPRPARPSAAAASCCRRPPRGAGGGRSPRRRRPPPSATAGRRAGPPRRGPRPGRARPGVGDAAGWPSCAPLLARLRGGGRERPRRPLATPTSGTPRSSWHRRRLAEERGPPAAPGGRARRAAGALRADGARRREAAERAQAAARGAPGVGPGAEAALAATGRVIELRGGAGRRRAGWPSRPGPASSRSSGGRRELAAELQACAELAEAEPGRGPSGDRGAATEVEVALARAASGWPSSAAAAPRSPRPRARACRAGASRCRPTKRRRWRRGWSGSSGAARAWARSTRWRRGVRAEKVRADDLSDPVRGPGDAR